MVLRMESMSRQRHKDASLPRVMIVAVLLLLSMFSVPFTPLTNGLSTAASPQPPAPVAHPESHPDCVGCGQITAWGCSNAATQACTPSAALGHFQYPGGVAVDSSGNPSVYVIDIDNKRVQKFDSNGGNPSEWGCSPFASSVPACPASTAVGHFNGPLGVAVDSSGSIVYVADTWNDRVEKFTSSGGNPSVLAAGVGTGDGQFSPSYPLSGNLASGPTWVAVDPSGNVYVADTGNNRVEKFSSSGSFSGWAGGCTSGSNCVSGTSNGFSCTLATCGAPVTGSGNGQFNVPNGVAVDPVSGNVYVVDSSNYRVQKFTSSGSFITAWGSQGSGNGHFIGPLGVAVDPVHGDIYVTDFDYTGNSRVEKFDSSGNPSPPLMWGSGGQGSSQFNMPFGVAVDSSGCVYVADYGNHRVLKFGDSCPLTTGTPTITVTPGTATNQVGSSHTVTATVLDNAGAPLVGVTVTFKVTSGPNAGKTGTCVTNSLGQCTFTYSDTGGAGTDNIVATFTDASGTLHNSNTATKTWQTTITTTSPCVNVTNLSTGLDSNYHPLPYLTTDAHWTVVLPSGVTDYPDSINAAGVWYNGPSPIQVGPGGQADWITPHGGHDASGYPLNLPGGTYDYSLHFHVYTPSTLVIDGYAADNGVQLLITPHPPLLPNILGPTTTITGPGGTFTGLLIQPVQPITAPPPFNPTIPTPQTFNLITPGDYSLHAFVYNYGGTGTPPPGTFTGLLVAARVQCGCFTDITTTVTYPKVTAAASTVTNTTLVTTTCCTSSTTITGTSINPGADFRTTWTSTSCVSCTSLTTITGTSTLNLPFVSKTTWTNTTCLGGGCTTTRTVTHTGIGPSPTGWTAVTELIPLVLVIAGIAMAVSYIISKRKLLQRSRASPKVES